MGEDTGYIEEVSSPEIEYSMFLDDTGEVSQVQAISEPPVASLTIYHIQYDEEIFDPLNRGDHCFADHAGQPS